ncbi:MAG TPA: ATP-binding protein [Opitutaceae bacterium]|nr:ATP-binding protein [Opitutaceae bacterium]
MRDDVMHQGVHKSAMIAWTHDLAPFGVVTTDREMRVQFWNQWLEVHTGLSATAVLGRPLFELFPDVPARGLDATYTRAIAGEVSVLSAALHGYLLAMPAPVRESGYERMQQTARVAPLRIGDAVVGTLTIIDDVTQREFQSATLRRQHERDRLLSWALARLLKSNDPLKEIAEIFAQVALSLNFDSYLNHLLDADSQVLKLHAAGGLMPQQRDRMQALPVGVALCGRCAELRAPVLINHLQSNADPQAEISRSFGMRAYAAFPLLIGERLLGTISFATATRDVIVTEETDFLARLAQYVAIAMDRAVREDTLRDAEERLRGHAATLETKIAERTAALHETIVQLESFSYTVAHDLRAPIRSLTSFSEIVLNDYKQHLPEEALFLLQRVHRAGHRLDALTRDLLRFSKVSRTELTLMPTALDDLVGDIVQMNPALAEAVTIQSPLGTVWGHPTLLLQCFSNLFDNALKFGAPGRKLRLVVRSETVAGTDAAALQSSAPFSPARLRPPEALAAKPDPTRQTLTRIWIEDNGIGIAAESHEKIFGIFERVSGLDAVEGTGIGLAIVARAMERMGGFCGVQSELGEGSRFWLELPSAGPAAAGS